MMNIFDILLLSIAVSMDCFALSILSGVILGKKDWRVILQLSFLFGFFQAMMPLIGWYGTSQFKSLIENFDHWIAFGLLLFLGVKMTSAYLHPEQEKHFDPSKLKVQLLLALADSIDALAVGISFACTGYNDIKSLSLPLWAIGIASFLFSIAGCLLGIRFGARIRRNLKPELIGGIILVFIGFKILFNHIFGW